MTESPQEPGLRTPHQSLNPVIEAVESPKRWTRSRIAVQVAGFILGLGLLGLTIYLATTGDNAAQFQHMRDAPPTWLIALLAVSAASIVVNGVMFWFVLLPLRRLNLVDVVAVNAIAVFLALLPFKLGLLIRALIHHRRDGVPFKQLLAWFAAISALALAIVLPMALASLWRGQVDALWWLAALIGPVVCTAVGVGCGRIAPRYPILSRLSLGADAIVKHLSAVVPHFIFRCVDVACLAARFLIAAKILGHEMTLDQAILTGTTYFLLSVVAPTGVLGAREAGTAGVGLVQGLDVAGIALLVTAAETLAAAALGTLAAWRLRLHAVLLSRRSVVDAELHQS